MSSAWDAYWASYRRAIGGRIGRLGRVAVGRVLGLKIDRCVRHPVPPSPSTRKMFASGCGLAPSAEDEGQCLDDERLRLRRIVELQPLGLRGRSPGCQGRYLCNLHVRVGLDSGDSYNRYVSRNESAERLNLTPRARSICT